MGKASYTVLREGIINACAHCHCSLLVIITNSCPWSSTMQHVSRPRGKSSQVKELAHPIAT